MFSVYLDLPSILRYVFKVIYQFFTMIWVIMLKTKKPACVLLQASEGGSANRLLDQSSSYCLCVFVC